jgi:hypothetical protein
MARDSTLGERSVDEDEFSPSGRRSPGKSLPENTDLTFPCPQSPVIRRFGIPLDHIHD